MSTEPFAQRLAVTCCNRRPKVQPRSRDLRTIIFRNIMVGTVKELKNCISCCNKKARILHHDRLYRSGISSWKTNLRMTLLPSWKFCDFNWTTCPNDKIPISACPHLTFRFERSCYFPPMTVSINLSWRGRIKHQSFFFSLWIKKGRYTTIVITHKAAA